MKSESWELTWTINPYTGVSSGNYMFPVLYLSLFQITVISIGWIPSASDPVYKTYSNKGREIDDIEDDNGTVLFLNLILFTWTSCYLTYSG